MKKKQIKTPITKKSQRGSDIVRLMMANKALQETSPAMRKPTLEFLWDKFVVHGNHVPKSGTGNARQVITLR